MPVPALALDVFLLVFAGLLGVAGGVIVATVVETTVTTGSLGRNRPCPHCAAPVKPLQNAITASWALSRRTCSQCKNTIPLRYPFVELATATAFLGVAWAFVGSGLPTQIADLIALALVFIALLYLAAVSIALALIDVAIHRLPNAIVLPSILVAGVLFITAAALSAQWDALLGAIVGMAALYAFYFVLRLIRPGGMGGGDVKLAGLLGIYLGWLGWGALAVGTLAAFVLGGIFGVALLLTRRAGPRTAIPFGPWMLAGAWIGIIFGERLARWYFG